MAEYAGAKRCVRTAAGGFSPDLHARMPAWRSRRRLHFQNMLESRTPIRTGKTASRAADHSGGNPVRICRNQGICRKNRKKENNWRDKLFCVEIMAALVYCNMVFFCPGYA
ncbi:MAG: hypothetical protein IJD60_04430 [Clostridia bacterium]|nr:hypothetical protein [Clostridia bacterium]